MDLVLRRSRHPGIRVVEKWAWTHLRGYVIAQEYLM